MPLMLNEAQEKAVKTTANTVVTASAGTGKTRVISERFLKLVLDHHVPITDILTLTFTRKAATEMYERIYQTLMAHSDDPFIHAQLHAVAHIPISTFDSFCAQLVRDQAPHFGITAQFRQDEAALDMLIRHAALRFLNRHSNERVLKRFIAINGFDGVWKGCLLPVSKNYMPIGKENYFSTLVADQFGELKREIEAHLSQLEHHMRSIGDRYGDKVAAYHEGIAPYRAEKDGKKEMLLAIIDSLEEISRLRKLRNPSSDRTKEAQNEHIAIVREKAKILIRMIKTIQYDEDMEQFCKFLAQFHREVSYAKRKYGLLSYSDVISLAIVALRELPELHMHYAKRFAYIMVDEFQDTNEQQKELLYLLALDIEKSRTRRDHMGRIAGPIEPEELAVNRLFFVGDDKQSIYRFRGADVQVFNNLAAEMERAQGGHILFQQNYRSHPRLIDIYNMMFESIMAHSNKDYESKFVPMEAGKTLAANGREKGDKGDGGDSTDTAAFHIFVFQHEDEDEDKDKEARKDEVINPIDNEAFYISRFITQKVEEQSLPIWEKELVRPARWGDFCLLFRSSAAMENFERMFRRFGIPYTMQGARNLFRDAPAHDLYNILQLCIYPEDIGAYIGFLRSPLVGISDDALLIIINREAWEGAPHPDPGALPFTIAPRMLEKLSREDREKYEAAKKLYHDILERSHDLSMPELLDIIWYEYGYRYLLLTDPQLHPYLDHYDYLFQIATEKRTLIPFLNHIRAGLHGTQNYAVRQEQGGAVENVVRMMTVHQAKGLEFPVVIVANAHNVGRGEASNAPFYYSERFGLTFNLSVGESDIKKSPNIFYELSKDEDTLHIAAELKRLLYVALTRAESHLIVSGMEASRTRAPNFFDMILKAAVWDRYESADDDTAPKPIVENISLESEEALRSHVAHLFKKGRTPKVDMRAAAAAHYSEAPVVYHNYVRERFSVSSLNSDYFHRHDKNAPPRDSEHIKELPPLPCDPILASMGMQAEFGELCHRILVDCIDARIPIRQDGSDSPIEILREYTLFFPKLIHIKNDLDENMADEILISAYQMAIGFFQSPLAQALPFFSRGEGEAKIATEFPFIMCRKGKYIYGRVDLFVELPTKCLLLDWKTNLTYRTGEYDLQLALYRHAAETLVRKPVDICCYYLRDGSMVERTPISGGELDTILNHLCAASQS